MPDTVKTCAVYLAGDGSLGLAWEQGVCVLTPMEAQMGGISLAGKNLILHDSKSMFHRLDDMDMAFGSCVFDTALAAYDLNPSQSDYPVSKLATNFLAADVADGDAAACVEAIWNLRPILEDELKKLLPGVAIARMDVDTTSGKEGHAKILDEFRSGRARILVGTQMIAKGLDYPDVTLVGILNGDEGLNRTDYRSCEDTFDNLYILFARLDT